MEKAFTKTAEQAVQELNSDAAKGLTQDEASVRLVKYGPNSLGEEKKVRQVGVKAVCKTPKSIKNDADIEAYVSSIRTKLKEQLLGNDELVIL